MKKARVMMATIAIFVVVGGALAFKAKTQQNTFYGTGTTTIGTKVYTTGCVVRGSYGWQFAPNSPTTIPYSTTFNSIALTCVAHVIPNE